MLNLIAFLLAGAPPIDPLPLAQRGSPPEKVVALVVYGSDACPRSTDPDEITVCARQPESERYRVPKRFRDRKPLPAQESWANTATQLEWVSRIGTPNSCSPVGSGGQTGCMQQFIRMAREERRQAERDAAQVP